MAGQPQGADFGKMSKDDLAKFINDNQPSEKAQPEGTTADEKIETDDEDPREDNPQASSETDEDAIAPTEASSKSPERDSSQRGNKFESKSHDELLKIIRDQQSFIGRQASTIGDLKKITTKPEPEVQKADIDTKGYKTEDVQFIRELINKEFGNITKQEQQQREAERQQAFVENQKLFGELCQDAELFEVLAPILHDRLQLIGEEARYQKGWVKGEVDRAMRLLIKSKGTKQPQGKPTTSKPTDKTDKKLKASTVRGGGVPPTAFKKAAASMNAKEYLQYIQETMGVKDIRRK